MNILKLFSVTLCLVFFASSMQLSLRAQDAGLDYNEISKLQASGKLKQASRLLAQQLAADPENGDILWAYARNEYWRKRFRKSAGLYRKAFGFKPDDLDLKIDYLDFLINTGRYSKAKSFYETLSKTDQNLPQSLLLMSRLNFWRGNFNLALTQAEKAKKKGSNATQTLLNDIKKAKAPGMELPVSYSSDTQPLERFDAGIKGSWFFSSLLDLSIDATSSMFFSPEGYNSTGSRFSIGNKVRLTRTGTEIGASAGIFKGLDQKDRLIYRVSLKQRILHGLTLSISHRQEPYLYTLSSLESSFGYRINTLQLEWQQRHGWWFNVGGQQELFQQPDNTIFTWYGWVMSPEMKLGAVNLRLGYSISWADAFVSQYEALDDIDVIMGYWQDRQFIEGRYIPYFTPSKMLIHNALFLLDWKINHNLNFILSGDYGFLATAQNPYLFPELVDINRFGLRRAFDKFHFTPFKIDARMVVQLNRQADASLYYNYTRIFFFDMRSAGVQLGYRFMK